MAIIKQGILGAFSGKVGAVVGSSWKGIAVMKSRPASVANPKTAKQLRQRGAMSAAVNFAQPILGDVIKPLNDRFAQKMSGYNLFIQRNIDEFKKGALMNPADVSIAPTVHAGTPIMEAKKDPVNGKIKLEWLFQEGTGFQLATDVPYIVLYDGTNKSTFGFAAIRKRYAGVCVWSVPNTFPLTTVSGIYLAFLRVDGSLVFASTFTSSITDGTIIEKGDNEDD